VSFDIDLVLLHLICRSNRLYAPHSGGYRARIAADGVELLTPAKQGIADNETSERRLGPTQLAIESAYSNLKGQMRLDQHLGQARRPRATRCLGLEASSSSYGDAKRGAISAQS
jgi:hypothetical protein